MFPFAKRRSAFTLIELIVVIAITGTLTGLLLAGVQKVRAAAARVTCQNQLKQLALAAHQFNDAYGKLPPMAGYLSESHSGDYGNTFFFLLPYLEHDNLYRMSWDGRQHTLDNYSNGLYARVVPMFLCPSDFTAGAGGKTDWAPASYAANFRVFGQPGFTWQGASRITASFRDGTSTTILFTEKYARCGSYGTLWARSSEFDYWAPTFALWTTGPNSMFQLQPHQSKCDPTRAATAHSAAINVAMADGSVRALGAVNPDAWWALCTPNGGEPSGVE